jgi:hypothetical protein
LRVFALLRRSNDRFVIVVVSPWSASCKVRATRAARLQVDRVLSFVGQVHPAIFHLRDLIEITMVALANSTRLST